MEQMCVKTGKRCFASKEEARRGMRRLSARLRVYLCEFCRLFHLMDPEKRQGLCSTTRMAARWAKGRQKWLE